MPSSPYLIIHCFVDYTLFRRDRNANGGGVSLYVHDSLHPSRVPGHRSLELIAVTVNFCRQTMVVASCYRPPNQTTERAAAFVSDLTDWLANLGSSVQSMCLLGDFNADPAGSLGRQLCQTVSGLGLTQIVTDSTHRNKILDLCFVGHDCPVSTWGLAPTFERQLDGHAAVFLMLYNTRTRKFYSREFTSYRFCDADWNQAAFELLYNAEGSQRSLIAELAAQESADAAAAHLSSVLLRTMHMCIPHKTLRIKRFVPWMTRDLVALIRRKSAAYKNYKSQPNPSAKAKYRELHKSVHSGVKAAKRGYVLQTFESVSNPSQFWKAYKKIAGSKICSLPSLKRSDGSFAVKNAEKAELISQAFASNFNERDTLPPALAAQEEIASDWLCTSDFVQDKLDLIRLNCASGLDNLPVRFLRGVGPAIVGPLTTVINRCVAESAWPVIWKQARMAPVPKVSAPTFASEFRPVSILPILSKIAEAWVLQLLEPYLTTSAWQFGFKKGCGTEDAVATATHLIATGWESCPHTTKVAVVSLDIARAFDQVPHFALLTALQHRSCPNPILRLLRAYLLGRSQTVQVNGSSSVPVDCRSGVPQGSILGPYLFNAYVDKVFQTPLSKGTSILLYADDCLLIRPICCDEDEELLAQDLESVRVAYENLFLKVNPSKSQLLVCSLSPTGAQLQQPVEIGGQPIPQVHTLKYLGVYFDSKLDFQYNATCSAMKTKQCLGALKRSFGSVLDSDSFAFLYKARCLSVLTYSLSVSSPRTKHGWLCLEKANRLGLRYVSNDYSSRYVDLLDEYRFKSVARLCFEQRCRYIYKHVHGLRYCPALPQLISVKLPVRGHEL